MYTESHPILRFRIASVASIVQPSQSSRYRSHDPSELEAREQPTLYLKCHIISPYSLRRRQTPAKCTTRMSIHRVLSSRVRVGVMQKSSKSVLVFDTMYTHCVELLGATSPTTATKLTKLTIDNPSIE
jgi:hypothetical protein